MATNRLKLKFEDVYPAGHKTLKRWFDVAGLSYRIDDVLKFASWKHQSVSMKPEPKNRHDPNAMAVFGRGSKGFLIKR